MSYVTHEEFRSFISGMEEYFKTIESRSIQKEVMIESCLNILHEKLGVPKEDIEAMAMRVMEEFTERINQIQSELVEEATQEVEAIAEKVEADTKAESEIDVDRVAASPGCGV